MRCSMRASPRTTRTWCCVGLATFLTGGITSISGYAADQTAQGPPAQLHRDATAPLVEERTPKGDAKVDFDQLLSPLLSSQESRQVAADTEAFIRKGDAEQVQRLLAAVLEAGTLAALMTDHVQSPDLLAFLQRIEKPQPKHSSPDLPPVARSPAMNARVVVLETALARESKRAEAGAREIEALRADLAARDANLARRAADAGTTALETERAARADSETKLAQTKDELQHERRRAEAVIGDLETLRGQAAALKEELERERKRAEAEAAQSETLKSEHDTLRAAASRAAEQEQASERERQRANAAAEEITSLKAQLATATAERVKASEVLKLSLPEERLAQPASQPPAMQVSASIEQTAALHTDRTHTGTSSGSARSPAPGTQPAAAPDTVKRLLERAEALMNARDVIAARLLLERVAGAGSGRALLLLAESYDPKKLAERRIFGGVRGDEAKARELYAAARAAGIQNLAGKPRPP
jgi:hypothetical protein